MRVNNKIMDGMDALNKFKYKELKFIICLLKMGVSFDSIMEARVDDVDDVVLFAAFRGKISVRRISEITGLSRDRVLSAIDKYRISVSEDEIADMYKAGMNMNQIYTETNCSYELISHVVHGRGLLEFGGIQESDEIGFDILKRMYIDENKSPYKIGRELGRSDTYIRELLKIHGIYYKNRSGRGKKLNWDEAVKLYSIDKKSVNEVSKELGVSKSCVRYALKSSGVFDRYRDRADIDRIVSLHVEEGKSACEIGEELGLTSEYIRGVLKSSGVYTKGKKGPKARISKSSVINMYVNDGKSTSEIGKELGVTGEYIRKILNTCHVYSGEKRGPKNIIDKEKIISMYIDDGKNMREIASELQLTYTRVFNVVREYRNSQKDRIIALKSEGKDIDEIIKETGLKYKFIIGVIIKFNEEKRSNEEIGKK